MFVGGQECGLLDSDNQTLMPIYLHWSWEIIPKNILLLLYYMYGAA